MRTIRNECIAFFDVDDTLVMWDETDTPTVSIVDPHTGITMHLEANKNNITLMKEKKSRGFTIVVWSAGGYAWAEAVIKALNLNIYVDFVMSKPHTYVDDLDVAKWFPNRVWLDPKRRYKS